MSGGEEGEKSKYVCGGHGAHSFNATEGEAFLALQPVAPLIFDFSVCFFKEQAKTPSSEIEHLHAVSSKKQKKMSTHHA